VRLRGQQPVSQADAREYLTQQGAEAAIAATLASVLIRLWTAAWHLGLAAAALLAGAAWMSPQVLTDLLATYASLWSAEIARTVTDRLAAVLAMGGSASDLEAAMAAVMGDEAAARRVAQTEVTRASGAAAYEHYRAAGTDLVRWITEPPDPCPVCIRNSKDAPRHLGDPFSCGAVAPPQHPNCRCALIPAME
jgi:hypothetical protein